MDSEASRTSISLPQGSMQENSFQRAPSNSHQTLSQTSQTRTSASSGTDAPAQSATVTTETFEPVAYEAAFTPQLIFPFFFPFGFLS